MIDRHPEWLQFAEEVLQEQYDVLTSTSFEEVRKCCIREEWSQGFDLIFVGLDLAISNLDAIKSLGKQYRFLVIFPVFQDDEILRILFKHGAYDCADKPYDREGLLQLVADELSIAEQLNGVERPRYVRKQMDKSVLELERILSRN